MAGVRRDARRSVSLDLLGAILLLYLLVPVLAFVTRLASVSWGELWTSTLGSALAVSLETASVSTAVIAVLGIPLAYVLARTNGAWSNVLGFAIQLPLALPPLASGILLLYVIGPYTPVGQLFGGGLTDSPIGIVLAQTFVAAPFAVIASRSAFAAVSPDLEEVAATLGHSQLSRFFSVALPSAAAGIGAGLLLSWLRAFGEYGATVLVAYHPFSLPVFTYVQFSSVGLPATMGPAAFGLAAAVAALALARGAAALHRRPAVPRPLPQPRLTATEAGPTVAFALDARLGSFHLRVDCSPSSRRLAILGPSGAGKTFTLRLLAGLATADASRVLLGERRISELPPERRRVGYVPQDSALLPGLPLWRQITFGVRSDPAVAAHWLQALRLDGLEERRPEQLSGGQRRRASLARALSSNPAILLLDEPFTGLDRTVRDQLVRELRTLQLRNKISTVLVTHDPTEAVILADEILLLDAGSVVQFGPQREVFASPNSAAAARILGLQNLVPGRVVGPSRIRAGEVELNVPGLDLPFGSQVTWRVAPEALRLNLNHGFPAHVVDWIDLPGHVEVHAHLLGGPSLVVRAPAGAEPPPDHACTLDIPEEAITVWDRGEVWPAGLQPRTRWGQGRPESWR